MAFTTSSSFARWSHQQSSIIFRLRRHQTRPSPVYYTPPWRSPTKGLAFRGITTSSKSMTSGGDSDPPPFQYEHLEGVERLEKYCPGGYHPILIGDILRNRYRVVHKLGYGAYSTTWLCRDGQANKYVTVKVGTAESNPKEADILDFLNSPSLALLARPGAGMIPSVKDRFVLYGPNGAHPCYVTNPARCSISGAKDGSYNRLFQASTARSLIVQLVLAVEYIHARGIVHGG